MQTDLIWINCYFYGFFMSKCELQSYHVDVTFNKSNIDERYDEFQEFYEKDNESSGIVSNEMLYNFTHLFAFILSPIRLT